MEVDELSAAWRKILGSDRSWVLFENGTCVVLDEPQADLAAQAIALLARYGPVQAGTDAADFDVRELGEPQGWLVLFYHPAILVYLSPEEFPSPDPAEVMVGLIGRGRRDLDSQELNVVHVEDRRISAGS